MTTQSTSVKVQIFPLRLAAAALLCVPLAVGAYGQTESPDAARSGAPGAVSAPAVVPQQVRYAGKMASHAGETVETEFRIYAAQEAGEPLWTETQQVPVALDGSFAVLLGGVSPAGLPERVFAGGAARWLGVSVGGGQEQERVLLSSVPYAMKSADAESLAGHAASEFVTQAQLAAAEAQTAAEVAAGRVNQSTGEMQVQPETQPLANGALTGSGTSGTIPVWNGQYTEGNSNVVEVGNDIGINVTAPASALDVGGGVTVRGALDLPATAAATTAAGYGSQALEATASAWSTATAAPVAENFAFEATPVGSGTASPSGALALLSSSGANALAATGFSIASNGRLTFAAGQTFPGVITAVTGTSPITASTASGAVTVGLNTGALETTLNAVYPQLTAANTFHGNQTISGQLTMEGPLTGTTATLSSTMNSYGIISGSNVRMITPFPATATIPYNSPVFWFGGTAYNTALAASQTQNFVMEEVITGNNTATPAGYLSFLFGQGTASVQPTGLRIAPNGVITFSAAQTFPIKGTGGGTITSVSTTSPLTGSATSGGVTIGLNETTLATGLEPTFNSLYARLGGVNTFTSANTFNDTSLFNNYIQVSASVGAGTSAVNGYGTSGSGGVYGSSDTGDGVQGESTSGHGVYGQTTNPGPGADGVLGSTGTAFSAAYSSEAAAADAGVWADTSGAGSGVPTALFATADNAYGAAIVTDGTSFPALYVINEAGSAASVEATAGDGLDSSTSSGTGLYGSTEGGGDGVMGMNSATVEQEAGVVGVANTPSIVGASYNIYSGVWGDTGTSIASVLPAWSIGVLGTADDAYAGVFLNNSSNESTLWVENYSTAGTGLFKTLMAKSADGTCGIGSGGSLSCTGQIKSLVNAGDGSRKVETYAVQSPENWIEDFGSGDLRQGVAVVKIDAAFAETVTADSSYHVFLTPNGDSKGLYVIAKTPTTFEVRESGGGTSSLSFDYRIVAKRRGFEAQRLVDVTERFNTEMKASTMERSTGGRHEPKRMAQSPLKLAPGARPRVMAPQRMNRPHPAQARPVSATVTAPRP